MSTPRLIRQAVRPPHPTHPYHPSHPHRPYHLSHPSTSPQASTFQLNQDKLEYNHKVLVERSAENARTRDAQKRRRQRQRDTLATLKERHRDLDGRAQEENARLTDEYRRITELFKDLQHKFRHFEDADWRAYQEVWAHNDQLIAGHVRRVLEADKVIHEQLLGESVPSSCLLPPSAPPRSRLSVGSPLAPRSVPVFHPSLSPYPPLSFTNPSQGTSGARPPTRPSSRLGRWWPRKRGKQR